ncbi:hypothetical protein Poly41_70730 [Novipirellula artificiosorum]|uniref:Uncharacterized protein n=1 Tax=Novipirellula artificiosorum TaxID=2528016 RepID=A0A5C6CP31_9BACT|nr:hypothetical protein Poly41_70730 [Novipirellula artificiosorum]
MGSENAARLVGYPAMPSDILQVANDEPSCVADDVTCSGFIDRLQLQHELETRVIVP